MVCFCITNDFYEYETAFSVKTLNECEIKENLAIFHSVSKLLSTTVLKYQLCNVYRR